MVGAATVAAALMVSACSDVSGPGGGTVATSDLIVLGVQSAAPGVAAQQVRVSNAGPTSIILRHADASLTPYAEVDFPPGALSSLNGTRLFDTSSVLVTVTPSAGGYGVTISPSGLEFTLSVVPTVTFFFARYADPSVAANDPTYPDATSYVAALDVWSEISVDQWRVANGSGAVGSDEVSAAIDAPGTYVLAAVR